MVIEFSDLGLEVPQFTLQVVASSLLIQEARILGEQELRKFSWHSNLRSSRFVFFMNRIHGPSFRTGPEATDPGVSTHRPLLLQLSPDTRCHVSLLLKGEAGQGLRRVGRAHVAVTAGPTR